MFETFALIAFFTIGGDVHAFTIDHDLTADDCAYVAQEVAASDGIELAPGFIVPAAAVVLECEPDA